MKSKIRSPFFYVGDKYKLMPQLEKLFPVNINNYYEPFVGGGSSFLNTEAKNFFLNDINEYVIQLHCYLQSFRESKDKFFESLFRTIEKYGLSCSFLGKIVPDKLKKEFIKTYYSRYNKENYMKMREDYNKNKSNFELLYLLLIYGFNHMIRFNLKGEFNLPVVKRDFNSKMRNKLILFSKKLKEKDIEFYSKDFRDIDINKISKDTFIYCDPPYLITTAGYNENGMWTDKEEKDLLNFLKELDKKGLKFALSNVLESKNKENKILKDWILENNFYCNYLKKDYSNSNYQRKEKDSISVEVLVTNYNTEEM